MDGKSFLNVDSFFDNRTPNQIDKVITISNMLVSMFADEAIPANLKPQLWGEVRKDTLTDQQFNSFLQTDNTVIDWFRTSFPELAHATIIGDDRKATEPHESKIAVYFEVKDGFIIVYPVGFVLPGGNVFKCGERADVDECRKLTEHYVFFGPDAKFASAMTHDVLMALQHLRRNLLSQVESPIRPLPHTLKDLHHDIEIRVRYQAHAKVLAPVLNLAVVALNDPAKRKDMGRWLRSEYLKDKMVFIHACALLDIEINTNDDGVVVRYL